MEKDQMTRREFSKSLLAAMGRSGVIGRGYSESTLKLVALQLFTIRELTEDDFLGAVEKVAKIGYDALEFAGYGGLSAKEVKQLIDNLGLIPVGSHEGFEGLAKGLEARIEFNLELGNKYIVVPSMPGQWRDKGVDGFKQFGERLNVMGEKIKQAGMGFCYHNHNFEFEKVDGKYLYDHLFEATDPELVKAQVDIYWVQVGGEDPVAHLKKYAGRCPLLHMKDMTAGEDKMFAPVGAGIIDMKGIIQTARETGAEWFIVEQDSMQLPVLEAIEISLKNMRNLLKT